MPFGRQTCGNLEAAANREWLVTDGLGGYAMGTVAGLRTRGYHGLLAPAASPPGGRRLGLAALDPVAVLGDRRIRLAVHEWTSGAVDPTGHTMLSTFDLEDGVPRWRYDLGEAILEREVAMQYGRPVVAVVFRLLRALRPVRLEVSALCTWREAGGRRGADGAPACRTVAGGFVFEDAYRVEGPGYQANGAWYRGAHYRVEADRGLPADEDLWDAGTFNATLGPGDRIEICAWADDLAVLPRAASAIVAGARDRARAVVRRAKPADGVDARLALAADQMIVAGPTVNAGYPWFGEWSRDTMTSYEGLFLETGRADEGRRVLDRAASRLSEGMLTNTADTGRLEYNTADATLWFLHAAARHVEVTGDRDLAASLAPALRAVVDWHVRGTRYGIRVDERDGLLVQGAPGVALTWMDARVDGQPVTPRAGKAVEINALWVSGLSRLARLLEGVGEDPDPVRGLEARARSSFRHRFWTGTACLDLVDGDPVEGTRVRPNALFAVSLPDAPLRERPIVDTATAQLLTSLGLRSLSPADPAYRGRHRGTQAERDRAYHQGTIWPWLIGPYVEAALKVGAPIRHALDGLEAHLDEWGLGSISETADGDPPHEATGCPFQAWSVAEMIRARRLLARAARTRADAPAAHVGAPSGLLDGRPHDLQPESGSRSDACPM
ncbi:MAG TPA: amylo-alpha-1,6-glucosidase [Candidatus Limnocylindrales bacterium]|nr:amylo-alpha-1,6-glucosidase [Candidatus Limnocylindrales bacterium]